MMSVTIDLPDELAVELNAEAAMLGLPLKDYALRVLSTGRIRSLAPKNGAELVEYWRQSGTIGNRPEIIDPAQRARDLRNRAEIRGGESS